MYEFGYYGMEHNENCVKLIMIGPAQWFKGNITLFLKSISGLHNSKNDKKRPEIVAPTKIVS